MVDIKKILSSVLVFAFLTYNVSFALTEEELLSLKTPEAALKEELVLTANTIGVPKDFGTIKDRFIGKDPRFIIHIQDAHTNYEAQSNIANILEALYKEYKIDFISLEGADGIIDTTWFKAFPDAEIRREVADYFMRKGEITGAEFLSITTDYPVTLFGAETRDLYIKNLNAFTTSYAAKDTIEKYFLGIKGILNKLKNYIYTKTLREIDSKIEDYKEKRLSLSDYARFLNKMIKKHKIPLHAYPNFGKLVYTLKYEDKIDFKVVDRERSALIDALSKTLSKDSLSDLVLKSFSFKTGKISSAEYYEYLKNLSEQNGIVLQEVYPNLHYYCIYTRLYEKINNELLFKEMDGLKEEIKEKYFVNDDQETLNRLSLNIGILLDLVNIRLSNIGYEYYKSHKEDFDPNKFLGFIHKQVLKYNLSYDLTDAYAITLENMPRLEAFYEMALVRDEALVENTLKSMDENNKRIAVLVTGGFHTEGIINILKRKGVSYAVVTPSITKEAESLYIQVLTGQRMTFEDIMFDAAPVPEEKAEFLVRALMTFLRNLDDEEVEEIGGGVLVAGALNVQNGYTQRVYSAYSEKVRKAGALQGFRLNDEEIEEIFRRKVRERASVLRRPEVAEQILARLDILERLERIRERVLRREDVAEARSALLGRMVYPSIEIRTMVEAVLDERTTRRDVLSYIARLPVGMIDDALKGLEMHRFILNENVELAYRLLRAVAIAPMPIREVLIKNIIQERGRPQEYLPLLQELAPDERAEILLGFMTPEFPQEIRRRAQEAHLLIENPEFISRLPREEEEVPRVEIEEAMKKVEGVRIGETGRYVKSRAVVSELLRTITNEKSLETTVIDAVLDIDAVDLEEAIDRTRLPSYTTNETILRNVLIAREILAQLHAATPGVREALIGIIRLVSGPYAMPGVLESLSRYVPEEQEARQELTRRLAALTSFVFPESIVLKTQEVRTTLLGMEETPEGVGRLLESVETGEDIEKVVRTIPLEQVPEALRQLSRLEPTPSEGELRVIRLETDLFAPEMAPNMRDITPENLEREISERIIPWIRREIESWNTLEEPGLPPNEFIRHIFQYIAERLLLESDIYVELRPEGLRYTEVAGVVMFDGFEVARFEEDSLVEGTGLEAALASLIERPTPEALAALAPSIRVGPEEERMARPAAPGASEEEVIAWMKRFAAIVATAYRVNRDEIRSAEAPVMVFEPVQIKPYLPTDERIYVQEMKSLERGGYVTFVQYSDMDDILENMVEGVPFTIIGFTPWFEESLVPDLRKAVKTEAEEAELERIGTAEALRIIDRSKKAKTILKNKLLPIAMMNRTSTGFKEYESLDEITEKIHPPLYRGIRVTAILLAKFQDKDVTENTPIYRQLQLLLSALSGLRWAELRNFIGHFLGAVTETIAYAFSRIKVILKNILVGKPPEPFGRRADQEHRAAKQIHWSL